LNYYLNLLPLIIRIYAGGKVNTVFISFISDLELGEAQSHKNLSIIPLFNKIKPSINYLTLKEALEKGVLTISEVSSAGSVPELQVKNDADLPVLLLDGEELCGAKQNRVLNTSILIKEKSETTIPVSCTEHGRWAYRSEVFADSNLMLASSIRKVKLNSVSKSLRSGHKFRSDQSGIWDHISYLAADAGVKSDTGAMRDLFKARDSSMEEYVNALSAVPGQKGLICMIDNSVVGMDILSGEDTYTSVHSKLIKSYAIDAMHSKVNLQNAECQEKAREFLKEATLCEEQRHESVGYGWDCRFKGDSIVGSALLHNDEVIHMTFFRIRKGPEQDENFASLRMRLNSRMRNHGITNHKINL
jgi:hypothetical protein